MLHYFKFNDKNKTWNEITREERFFCAELYQDIKKDIIGFIKFLNRNCSINLDENTYWEIGYEVCFYRDFIKAYGSSIKKYNKENFEADHEFKPYPQKRTFDLCLFSNDEIVIIEAKADQKFKEDQLKDFNKDDCFIKQILKDTVPNVKVTTILLSSSWDQKEIQSFIDKRIYWNQLSMLYNNKIYDRAEELGKKKDKDIL